jgi:hypothetical protein
MSIFSGYEAWRPDGYISVKTENKFLSDFQRLSNGKESRTEGSFNHYFVSYRTNLVQMFYRLGF